MLLLTLLGSDNLRGLHQWLFCLAHWLPLGHDLLARCNDCFHLHRLLCSGCWNDGCWSGITSSILPASAPLTSEGTVRLKLGRIRNNWASIRIRSLSNEIEGLSDYICGESNRYISEIGC